MQRKFHTFQPTSTFLLFLLISSVTAVSTRHRRFAFIHFVDGPLRTKKRELKRFGDIIVFGHISDDEEEIEQSAYRNRSLAWTQKYRKLIPYENARQRAMALGLRSKDEWDECLEDGTVHLGPYLPNKPDEMYLEEWVSWDEFLGLMRPYEEARHIVQNILKLDGMDEYENFVNSDIKRAEGLRIPAKPDIVYQNSGWDPEDFFSGQDLKNK